MIGKKYLISFLGKWSVKTFKNKSNGTIFFSCCKVELGNQRCMWQEKIVLMLLYLHKRISGRKFWPNSCEQIRNQISSGVFNNKDEAVAWYIRFWRLRITAITCIWVNIKSWKLLKCFIKFVLIEIAFLINFDFDVNDWLYYSN